jgi:hypothetical protein
MANDRIAIRCKYCGEGYTIAKYYPGNLYLLHDVHLSLGEWLAYHINERLEKEWKVYGGDLECEAGFEFVTEDSSTATGMMYYPKDSMWSGQPVFNPAPHFKLTQKEIDDAVVEEL